MQCIWHAKGPTWCWSTSALTSPPTTIRWRPSRTSIRRPGKSRSSNAERWWYGPTSVTAQPWNTLWSRRFPSSEDSTSWSPNAGIAPLGSGGTAATFVDAFDVDFVGVVNVFSAAIPRLSDGASLIATGSVAAIRGAVDNPASGPGGAGYAIAKAMIVEYTKSLAKQLAPQKIRVNAVHPTNCNTEMLHNHGMYRLFRPDLEDPTTEDVFDAFGTIQAMPIPYIEPADVSHAVVFLASDESRYVTGLQMTVDAGAALN